MEMLSPEREIMSVYSPVIVSELAAGDLEDIAYDLFSHNLIDGEVYEGLKLQTNKFQKARYVISNVTSKVNMNPMELPKFLDILRWHGMNDLLMFFDKKYCKL